MAVNANLGSSTRGAPAVPGRHLDEGVFYICESCSTSFTTFQQLAEHNCARKGSALYRCNVCLKRFNQTKDLDVHVFEHTIELPYVCPAKEKRSGHIDSQHVETPTGERLYRGTPRSKTRAGLTDHCLDVNGHSVKRSFKCDDCGKSFSRKSTLTAHHRIHREMNVGVRPAVPCELCPMVCATLHGLSRHLRTHGAKPRFKCGGCEKSFAQRSNLRRHTRTHTGERPHRCPVCSKAFVRKDYLELHLRKHTGDRPYQCYDCHRTFSTASALTRHTRTHRDVQPLTYEYFPEEHPRDDAYSMCDTVNNGAHSYKYSDSDSTHPVLYPQRVLAKEIHARRTDTYSGVSLSKVPPKQSLAYKRESTNEQPYGHASVGWAQNVSSCFPALHKDRPYENGVHSNTFWNEANLMRRKKFHTSEHPYECHRGCLNCLKKGRPKRNICNHGGRQQLSCPVGSTLIARNHFGEHYDGGSHECGDSSGPLIYDVAPRGFGTIHAENRHHQCQWCQRIFSRTSNLKRHIRSHHPSS